MRYSWNELIARLPAPHLLQTEDWGAIKQPLGWQAQRLIWCRTPGSPDAYVMHQIPADQGQIEYPADDPLEAAALLLVRQFKIWGIPTPFKLAYTPKGPLLNWGNERLRSQVLTDLIQKAKYAGALLLKMDPDVVLGVGVPGSPEAREDPLGQEVQEVLALSGWTFSDDQIQFRNTVLLDLTPEEDVILQSMKQKTRYNVRLAARKGVKVRPGDRSDLDLLYQLYAETAIRDGFVIRSEAYYRNLWRTFIRKGKPGDSNQPTAIPLIAEVNGEAVAVVIIFLYSKKAWFLYGMSSAAHRNLMPNYLLQWEAIKVAKGAGCTHYDMWGAPDHFDESDSLWGVFRFKIGFQGQVVRTLGAWDIPLRPWLYQLYTRLLPAILARMRKKGKARTESQVV